MAETRLEVRPTLALEGQLCVSSAHLELHALCPQRWALQGLFPTPSHPSVGTSLAPPLPSLSSSPPGSLQQRLLSGRHSAARWPHPGVHHSQPQLCVLESGGCLPGPGTPASRGAPGPISPRPPSRGMAGGIPPSPQSRPLRGSLWLGTAAPRPVTHPPRSGPRGDC